MSVQKVGVDDTDPSVVYSGQWTVQRSASAYGNSLHVSTSAGASASLSFTGISVNILGTIPPCTVTGSPVTYQVVLDASPVDWGTAACTTSTQNNVLFYSSTQLSNGPHKVTIIDEANESPMLMLDLFAYVTSSEGSGAGAAAGGTSAVGGGSGTTLSASVLSHPTTTSSQDAGTTSSATSAPQSSTNASSASTASVSSGKTSSGDQVTSSAQSSIYGSLPTPTSSQPSSNNFGNASFSQSSTTSHSHSTGPIIGGIVAAILVLVLVLLLLLYHLRKRKGRQSSYTSKIVMPFNINLRRTGADPESPLGASGGESHQNSTSELIERGRSTTVRVLSDSGHNNNSNNVNNRPLERSMPNNIVPFILDGVAVGAGRQQAELVVPGSARPSSVLDPEYAAGLGGPPSASSEKMRLGAGAQGTGASGGSGASSSSSSSGSGPATRGQGRHPDEKRRSGPRSPATNPNPRLSTPPSEAAPAYMLHPDPIPGPPTVGSNSNPNEPSSNKDEHQHEHSHHPNHNHSDQHAHYPSGLSASTDILSGVGTGASAEVPPAYNDCCAYPGPHHHHRDHQH